MSARKGFTTESRSQLASWMQTRRKRCRCASLRHQLRNSHLKTPRAKLEIDIYSKKLDTYETGDVSR